MNDLLERLIAKILMDLTRAQNASNRLSARISKIYQQPPAGMDNLKFFPVPNSLIKSFDFKLKFALSELVGLLQDDLSIALREEIQAIWLQLVQDLEERTLIKTGSLEQLQQYRFEFDQIVRINKVEGTSDPVIELLTRQTIKAFTNELNGKIKIKVNLAPLLEEWADRIRTKITEFVDIIVEEFSSATAYKTVFDLDKLNEIDSEILCSINVNVEMRNLKWGYLEEEPTGNQPGKRHSYLNLES